MSYMGKVRPTIALLTDDIADDQVTSAKIADTTIVNADVNASAAIAKTKLASLDVVNADVNASAGIVGSKLADNAITLAKMEDGTQGDILYYGASGAPTRLGFGTSGDFLKTQGTGANPVWATVSTYDGTPRWHAYLPSDQSISTETATKVNMTTEYIDTDSAYDATNAKFVVPTGGAGDYYVYMSLRITNTANVNIQANIHVNGSMVRRSIWVNTDAESNDTSPFVASIITLAESDYVEAYIWAMFASGTTYVDNSGTNDINYFGGWKLG